MSTYILPHKGWSQIKNKNIKASKLSKTLVFGAYFQISLKHFEMLCGLKSRKQRPLTQWPSVFPYLKSLKPAPLAQW